MRGGGLGVGSLLAYGLLTCASQQGVRAARIDLGELDKGSRTHRFEVLQHHLQIPSDRCYYMMMYAHLPPRLQR